MDEWFFDRGESGANRFAQVANVLTVIVDFGTIQDDFADVLRRAVVALVVSAKLTFGILTPGFERVVLIFQIEDLGAQQGDFALIATGRLAPRPGRNGKGEQQAWNERASGLKAHGLIRSITNLCPTFTGNLPVNAMPIALGE